VLKRVVRRALESRKTDRSTSRTQAPKPTPSTTSTAPQKPAEPASPKLTGIAARIAAGEGSHNKTTVSATSGAAPVVTSDKLSKSADGQSYWGPVDNESARAKAEGKNLIIDQWECISCGTCVENTDAVFHLPDDAKAVVVQQEGDMTLVQDAIDACPVTCIHWTDNPEEYEQLNDAEGYAP
tara:strand:- start:402 stop:947 length:546 start_codon:yes stop_codon:yes gene_type:complete